MLKMMRALRKCLSYQNVVIHHGFDVHAQRTLHAAQSCRCRKKFKRGGMSKFEVFASMAVGTEISASLQLRFFA